MKTLFVLFTIFMSVSLSGCTKEDNTNSVKQAFSFQFKGTVKKPQVTSYMYGTHTISNEGQTYALKSSTVNLDNYINKTITIKGEKIKGYPIDGGPEFIDVKEVE